MNLNNKELAKKCMDKHMNLAGALFWIHGTIIKSKVTMDYCNYIIINTYEDNCKFVYFLKDNGNFSYCRYEDLEPDIKKDIVNCFQKNNIASSSKNANFSNTVEVSYKKSRTVHEFYIDYNDWNFHILYLSGPYGYIHIPNWNLRCNASSDYFYSLQELTKAFEKEFGKWAAEYAEIIVGAIHQQFHNYEVSEVS